MTRKKCDKNDPQAEKSKFAADCVLPEHGEDEPHENSSGALWQTLDEPTQGRRPK